MKEDNYQASHSTTSSTSEGLRVIPNEVKSYRVKYVEELERDASRLRGLYEVEIKSLEGKLHRVQYLIKEYDQALEELLLHFESIAEHECAGVECSECAPSIMAAKIIKVWDSQAQAGESEE